MRLLFQMLAVVLEATSPVAARPHLALEYDVGPELDGCPGQEAFRASVQAQLGYDPFEPTSDRHVNVAITRRTNGFAGRIRWGLASAHWDGERKISSRRPDCSSIAAHLAFAVAVQIQLLATVESVEVKGPIAAEVPTPPAPPPESSPVVVPTPAVPVEPAAVAPDLPVAAAVIVAPPPPAPAEPVSLSVGLGSALAFGTSPGATGLGRLFLSVRRTWASVELAGDAALPVERLDSEATGFSLERFSAATAVCGHLNVLAACLTGAVGALRARGLGVQIATASTGAFYQVGVRLAARWAVGGRYFVAARADGLIMPSPWVVKVNDKPVWETPRTSAILGVDVGATLF